MAVRVLCACLAASCIRSQDVFLPPALSTDAKADHFARLHGNIQWPAALFGDELAVLRGTRDPPRAGAFAVSAAKEVHADVSSRAGQLAASAGHTFGKAHSMPSFRGIGRSSQSFRGNRTISPIDFGADPTGKEDSAQAFKNAMTALLASQTEPSQMAVQIVDLGGATLDLEGGEYLISQPVVVPPQYGNLRIRGGTLRAAPGFPNGEFLIMVGDESCDPKRPDNSTDNQGSCNEFIDISDILLDAAHNAAGCISIAATMGATIGPSAFVVGFEEVGISISGGHEVMVSEAWVAHCYWSDPRSAGCDRNVDKSTGIKIHGNDHILFNVIVFIPTNTAVHIEGDANLLIGVHVWNVGTNVGSGGIIFDVGSGKNRLMGCYLDTKSPLVLYNPQGVTIEDTFFLNTRAELHAVDGWNAIDGWVTGGAVHGLVIRSNTYTTSDSVVVIGAFTKVSGVVIADEIGAARSTRASQFLTKTNATKWEFDFSDQLLFPDIEKVMYSVSSSSAAFFQHLARPPVGRKVTVETSEPVDATITVEVEQGL